MIFGPRTAALDLARKTMRERPSPHLPASSAASAQIPRGLAIVMLGFLAGCTPSGRNDPSVEALIRSEVAGSLILEGRYEDGEIYIRGVVLGDQEASKLLSRLDELPSLEELRLSGASLNAQQVQDLRELTFLRLLGMGSCQLTDDRMGFLRRLTNLDKLSIAHCPVTDRGLENLSGMVKLEQLVLINTKVRGTGLERLQNLTKLRFIDLTGSPVDNDSVQSVNHFPKLETLYLIDTDVTRDGLMKLVDLHWLNAIGLPNKVVGPDHDERLKRENLNQLCHDFCDASIESRKRARAQGDDVPTSDGCLFDPLLDEVRRSRRN